VDGLGAAPSSCSPWLLLHRDGELQTSAPGADPRPPAVLINCHTVTGSASICGGRCAVAHWSMREDVVVRRHLAKYSGLPPPPWSWQPKTTAARTRLVHGEDIVSVTGEDNSFP